MNLIEAAKQALEALQSAVDHRKRFEVCANLRAAIAAEKAEPVAITLGDPISDPCGDQQVWLDRIHTHLPLSEGTKLYTRPAPKAADEIEALRKLLKVSIRQLELSTPFPDDYDAHYDLIDKLKKEVGYYG